MFLFRIRATVHSCSQTDVQLKRVYYYNNNCSDENTRVTLIAEACQSAKCVKTKKNQKCLKDTIAAGGLRIKKYNPITTIVLCGCPDNIITS